NFGGVGRGPTGVDSHIAAYAPARLLQSLQECAEAGLKFSIVRHCGQQHADAPHALALLRARSERPRRRAAEQRDELAASDSITSSARAGSIGGTSRPSALAALTLTINSKRVGCSTGRSAGLVPFNILSTYMATR